MTKDARISTGLPGHPKTKKLLRRLGHAGPLACIYLFIWAAANRSDGDLSGLSNEDIELSVDWTGENGSFVAAMVDVGFLDGQENSLSIHDWEEHNPWAAGAKDRSEASKFAALCKRYGRDGAANRMPDYATRMRPAHEPHAELVRTACEADAPSPSPLPSPLPLPLPIKKIPSAIAPPEGVSDNVWQDFKKLRSAKKAPLTQTALAGIEREAHKAGMSLVDALVMCCERGWAGFKSSWLVDITAPVQETTYQRSMREKYQTIAPSIAAHNPNAPRIDVNTFFDTLPAKKLEITNG